MEKAIKIRNLSKEYNLGQVGTGTLSRDLNRFAAKLRGKPDPYGTIAETNDRTIKSKTDRVSVLRDINLDVEKGEVLGIVGRNGAGKSTLLKILSGITAPTKGTVKYNGRMASLLEVGTGMHPEMTARENIFLNGAIMGMKRPEIAKKLDDIVDFAGIAKYIDTPIKRFSSGMTVRLGFAVAAFLEPEILVVDEVLAVGDAEFRKRAVGKMKEVSQGGNRTVLFVSHNLSSVSNLCTSAILLNQGEILYSGGTENVINEYLKINKLDNTEADLKEFINKFEDDVFALIDFKVSQIGNNSSSEFVTDREINVAISYEVKKSISGLRIGFELVNNANETTVFRSYHDDLAKDVKRLLPGKYCSEFKIPQNLLSPQEYSIDFACGLYNVRWITYKDFSYKISMINVGEIDSLYSENRPGIVMPKVICNTNSI